MALDYEKCVMVIDESLPPGIMTNAASIMGATLGKHLAQFIGPDVFDKSGTVHLGIISFPVPILKAGKEKIKALRQQLYKPAFSSLLVVDFSDVAQRCHTYDEFIAQMAKVEEQELVYSGIGICGKKKLVNKLTRNLALL